MTVETPIEDQPMSDVEFSAFMARLKVINTFLADADELPRFVRTLEHNQSIGPILNPGAFMQPGAFDAMRDLLELGKAYVVVYRLLKGHREREAEEAARV